MAYDLSARKEGTILSVRIKGSRTRESVWKATQEIVKACQQSRTPKVLLDVREFEGRLTPADNYELPTKRFPKLSSLGAVKAVAIVDTPDHLDRFALLADVAQSRGFNLRVFGDGGHAKKWLKKQTGRASPR